MAADPIDTAELRRLLEKATPGPWELSRDDHDDGYISYELYEGGGTVARFPDAVKPQAKRNAEFVRALVNAAPLLLDALDSTRKALAESEAAGAVLVEILKGEESHELDCAVYLETGPDCTCELQPANSYIRDAINNLPASVRRHVERNAALEECAAVLRLVLDEDCLLSNGPVTAGKVSAALAKLDAARRGEGPSNG